MKTQISVIGYFGYRTNKLDGQTVKTRDLTRLITEHYGPPSFYDTQEFRYKPLSIFRMFALVARSKQLVYLPAHGNLKYLFPLIWIISKLFCTRIHYFVVGGWLANYIEPLPIHRFMLRRISGIYPETHELEKNLRDKYGYDHVCVFKNFRFLETESFENSHESGKLKLVFMARVTKIKGLDYIFALGDYIFANSLDEKVSVDFYGNLNPKDESYFFDHIKKFPFMAYHGPLQPIDIHQTLSQYDALLLPTHYVGEGIPGSIVDAYMSGIPVIVTEWKYAHELVEDEQTGLIIPFTDGQDELNKSVERLLNDEILLNRMKHAAKEYGKTYSAEEAGCKLVQLLS